MSEQTTTPSSATPGRIWLKVVPAMAALLVLAAAVSFLLVKGPAKPALPGGAQQTRGGRRLLRDARAPRQAGAADPPAQLPRPAGRRSAQYRGKAVLVTFLYANCPDICPLIASNLRVALNMLGRRDSEVQVIAVSVDPRGDTPANVAHFVSRPRDDRQDAVPDRLRRRTGAHVGSVDVGAEREVGQPQLVAHVALVYGISASGKLTTIYPDSFEPSEIAHDVPRLAAQSAQRSPEPWLHITTYQIATQIKTPERAGPA